MRARLLLSLLRSGDLRARAALRRDLHAFLRLQFLGAALDLGLLEALRQPREGEELARLLRIEDPETFAAFLELGASLGALRRRSGRYALASRTARALARPENDPLAASVLELVDYHADIYRRLPEYLRGGEKGDYLATRGHLIARSSRLVEPVLGEYVRQTVRAAGRSPRILELGCGSGAYLLRAARANPGAHGIGVELREEVARAAAALLARNAVADRFSVVRGDALRLPEAIDGEFDLVTLYNNVYYFTRDERRRLFGEVRRRLVAGGRLLIASMMHGATPASLDLSLVLGVTRECNRLPGRGELVEELTGAGFSQIAERRLIPMEPFLALAAA